MQEYRHSYIGISEVTYENKKFIFSTIALVLSALIVIAGINVVLDPLFIYHKPWFGLQPVITNERYQNAGIAKNFNYDNVIIGNSLSQNFKSSDFDDGFGGTTVKLTSAGSHTIDWTYLLKILSEREEHPKRIIFNIDPYIFQASAIEMKHELPIYLYDNNTLNDVNYLFNFSILKDYTFEMLKKNLDNDVPDYNTAFMWNDDVGSGKEFVLSHYNRPEINGFNYDIKDSTNLAIDNINNLIPYIEQMENTEFYFYLSPFSMLYWDSQTRINKIDLWKNIYTEVCKLLLQYENVNVFLWTDNEMLNIMSDLDNYTDDTHYSPLVSNQIANRICSGQGLLTIYNYDKEINTLFTYINNFDYEALF